MHIVFVAPRFHTNQYFWVKALQDAGHSVSFWVRKKANTEEHALIEPRLIMSRPQGRSGRRRLYREFASLLSSERPDAVVVRNPGEPFGRAVLAPLRKLGIPVVLYSQRPLNERPPWYRRVATTLLQRRMGKCDARAPWITPIRGGRSDEVRAPRNWHYIPFVMEPDSEAEQEHATRVWCPGGVRRILMVGKYMRRKNHLLLVQALHELSRRYPVSLELVGGTGRDDYKTVYRDVTAYVSEHELDWVTLTPTIPYAELQKKMRNYDLFVLPSRDEAVGVSLLEAMGKGLPVVCSTTAGARDYVEHAGNGRIFESDSLTDLRDQLDVLLSDPAILPAMGRRSLELVRTVHSPEAFLDRFIPLLNH